MKLDLRGLAQGGEDQGDHYTLLVLAGLNNIVEREREGDSK